MNSDESNLQKKKSQTCVGFANEHLAKKEYSKAIKFYEKALKMCYSEEVASQLKRAQYLLKVEALGVTVSTTADAVENAVGSLGEVASSVKVLPLSTANTVKRNIATRLLRDAMKHWMRLWVYHHVLMRVYKHYNKAKLSHPFGRWRNNALKTRGEDYHCKKQLNQSLSIWRVRWVNHKISSVSLLIARRHMIHRSLQYWMHSHRTSLKPSWLLKSLRLAIITHYIKSNRKVLTAFKLFRNKSYISATIDKSIVKYRAVKLLTMFLAVMVNYVMNSCQLRKALKDGSRHYQKRVFARFKVAACMRARSVRYSEKADLFFKTKALQRWKLAMLNVSVMRKHFLTTPSLVSRVTVSSDNWRLALPANIPYKRTIKRWLNRIYRLANADYSLRQAALFHLLKVFRRMRFNCRVAENKTLKENRSSMLCKRRMMARSFKRLVSYTSRSVQIRYMSTFLLLHKRILHWRQRVDNLFVMKCGARRAQLRHQIGRLTESLHGWLRYAETKRRIRRCFRVFRAMHPLPVCSAVRRVFAAWKTDFMKYSKVKRVTRRLLLNDRKHRLQSHYFELWFDAYDERLYRRETVFKALHRLWASAQSRRQELQLLIAVVINHRSRWMNQSSLSSSRGHQWPRVETSFVSYDHVRRLHHSVSYESSYHYQDPSSGNLAEFLQYHLQQLEPRRKLKALYGCCRLRQWFGMWLTFHRDNRSASQLHHQSISVLIDEYKESVSRVETVSRKRDLWIQWRRLRAWYQLIYARKASLDLISLRVLCKQYFVRWIMRYNLQVMEKRLLVPNGYRNLTNVRQNDCLQLQTSAEASHLINKLKYSQFSSSENVDHSNSSMSQHYSVLSDNSSVIHRLIGDGSVDYSFAQGGSSVSKMQHSVQHSSVDTSKLSLIKRLSQPKRSGGGSLKSSHHSGKNSMISAMPGSDKSLLVDCSVSVGVEAPRLWGQLIAEDNTSEDSFRRTYSGQYLWKKMHGK